MLQPGRRVFESIRELAAGQGSTRVVIYLLCHSRPPPITYRSTACHSRHRWDMIGRRPVVDTVPSQDIHERPRQMVASPMSVGADTRLTPCWVRRGILLATAAAPGRLIAGRLHDADAAMQIDWRYTVILRMDDWAVSTVDDSDQNATCVVATGQDMVRGCASRPVGCTKVSAAKNLCALPEVRHYWPSPKLLHMNTWYWTEESAVLAGHKLMVHVGTHETIPCDVRTSRSRCTASGQRGWFGFV